MTQWWCVLEDLLGLYITNQVPLIQEKTCQKKVTEHHLCNGGKLYCMFLAIFKSKLDTICRKMKHQHVWVSMAVAR